MLQLTKLRASSEQAVVRVPCDLVKRMHFVNVNIELESSKVRSLDIGKDQGDHIRCTRKLIRTIVAEDEWVNDDCLQSHELTEVHFSVEVLCG